MRTRDVIVQEVIRALALGFVFLMFVAIPYRAGVLDLSTSYVLVGGLTLGCFLVFTFIRLRTGRPLMIQTPTGWAIVAAVTLALLLVALLLGMILEVEAALFPQGLWPWLTGLMLIVLVVGWGYWRSQKGNNREVG